MDIKKGKTAVFAELVTPKGEITGFSAIFVPSTKFNKEGTYSANIILSKEEGEKLLAQIKSVQIEEFKNFKKGKNDKCIEITAVKKLTTVDEETGQEIDDEEGRYVLKTSAKAKITEGKPTNKIVVFDAKGHPVKTAKIGEGTIARLKLNLVGYCVGGKVGVSVRLVAVQIIKLVEYVGKANEASFDGFEIEEDGYEFDETAQSEDEEAPETDVKDEWDDEQGF